MREAVDSSPAPAASHPIDGLFGHGRVALDSQNAVSIRRMSFSYRLSLPALLCLSILSLPATGADSPDTRPAANPKVRAILADLGKVENIGQVSLSPDGTHLAWSEREHGGHGRIMVSDAHGQGQNNWMPAKTARRAIPQWSPDSRALLFEGACGESNQTDLFVTSLNGKALADHAFEGLRGTPGLVAGWAAVRLPLCARSHPPGGSTGSDEAPFRGHWRGRTGSTTGCGRGRERRRGPAADAGHAACL